MKKLISMLSLVMFSVIAYAQTLAPPTIEFKTGRAAGNATESKMKDAPKKVFINRFRVFYQLVYVDAETAAAGVNRGKATATLTVGFEGIQESDLISNTDKIYGEFTDMLKGAGFEIMQAEDAKDIKAFKGWTMLTGGQINSAQVQGMAMVSPTGFKYYAKDVLPSGKEKVSFMDPSGFASIQLGKVPVINVDIFVPFMADSESGASKLASDAVGGVAKVVASPYFRISAENTKSSFIWSSNAVIFTPMKEDLVINGVFTSEKFKASAVAKTNTSYNMGLYSMVVSEDVNLSNMQTAKCDIEAYKKGLYMATSKYIKESTQLFLDAAAGKK